MSANPFMCRIRLAQKKQSRPHNLVFLQGYAISKNARTIVMHSDSRAAGKGWRCCAVRIDA
jgi:hypothetical protein